MPIDYYAQLFTNVRHALYYEWDPMGINTIPNAEDEYDSYAPRLTQMLMEHNAEKDIFAELWRIETDYLGLIGNRKATKSFAGRLIQMAIELRNQLNDR